MKKITRANYKKDKLYPAVARATAEILKAEGDVSPLAIMLQLQDVSREDHESWRRGRVPYLERVFVGSLGKAGRILRILQYHAESLNLRRSQTVYRRCGKGKRSQPLRFSKSAHRQSHVPTRRTM